jgi:hypothetical protein
MNAEELAAELRKLRKAHKESNAEAQKGREARKRLQDLEDEREKAEQDKLSADEKRQKQFAAAEARARAAEEKAAELEQRNRQLQLDDAIKTEADAQGLSPYRDLIADAIRGKRDNGIEIDPDSGKIIGHKEAIKKYIAAFPELVAGGLRRGGGTPGRDGPQFRVPGRDTKNDPPVPADQLTIDRQRLVGMGKYSI